MADKGTSTGNTFADEFLHHYLKNGIGAMSKSDIDALVMYLLDKYTHTQGVALQNYSNQVVSQTLRATVTRIRKLRYDAGLKYGGRVEDEARRRFVTSLGKAALDVEAQRITLIIEDVLARNWIQGEIKEHGIVFDGSFNKEIVRLHPGDFFKVLDAILPDTDVSSFRARFDTLTSKKRGEALRDGFASLLTGFVSGTARKLGGQAVNNLIGIPDIG